MSNTGYGRILRITPHPSSQFAWHEIQRAPDSGGSPDTPNAESIVTLEPGNWTYRDASLQAPDGSTVFYWRCRAVEPSKQDSSWSAWTDGKEPIPLIDTEGNRWSGDDAEGNRRVNTLYDSDGRLVQGIDIDEGTTVYAPFRHAEKKAVQDNSGEAAVTWDNTFQNVPRVRPTDCKVISFNSSLGTGSDQVLVLEAVDKSVSGCTAIAKNVQFGATTGQTDDFAAGNSLTAVSDTAEANLDPGDANDNKYHINYDVTLDLSLGIGTTEAQATLIVAFDSNDGGGWVERETAVYRVTEDDVSKTWNNEQVTIADSGLGLNDDVRIRIKSLSVRANGVASASFTVHGHNLPTDADATNGVEYTTATDTEESAMPSAEYSVTFEAEEVIATAGETAPAAPSLLYVIHY